MDWIKNLEMRAKNFSLPASTRSALSSMLVSDKTTSMEVYLVLIVDEFPQYLYQIPLQYIIHLGPPTFHFSHFVTDYHLLYYYNFHSCCQQ